MTCTKYLGIITAPLLPALNLGIFIGNFYFNPKKALEE